MHFQIEREDSAGELTTFRVHVVYCYPSDDNNWSTSLSTYKLVNLNGIAFLFFSFF